MFIKESFRTAQGLYSVLDLIQGRIRNIHLAEMQRVRDAYDLLGLVGLVACPDDPLERLRVSRSDNWQAGMLIEPAGHRIHVSRIPVNLVCKPPRGDIRQADATRIAM